MCAHCHEIHAPCRENAKKKDVRTSNIEAAKAVADSIRTSLGPRGMDKMVRTLRMAAFSCELRSDGQLDPRRGIGFMAH
jgi:chaperonin GroEL (HSP60 family)